MELIIPAFIAGLFTFLAPCTLPLVPGYLGFISGASSEDFADPSKKKAAKRKVIINGIAFVLGFSLVFIAFGALAGLFGSAVADFRSILTRVGGAFVILFGLFMTGIFKIPLLQGTHRIKMPTWLERGRPHNSVILGGAFGIGWTPCVGPVLGAILTLAATSTTALQGALLLGVFSLGLGVPFIAIAFGFGSAAEHIEKVSRWLEPISKIGGVFLVIIGLLLITDNLVLLISYGFRLLRFLGIEGFEEGLYEFL